MQTGRITMAMLIAAIGLAGTTLPASAEAGHAPSTRLDGNQASTDSEAAAAAAMENYVDSMLSGDVPAVSCVYVTPVADGEHHEVACPDDYLPEAEDGSFQVYVPLEDPEHLLDPDASVGLGLAPVLLSVHGVDGFACFSSEQVCDAYLAGPSSNEAFHAAELVDPEGEITKGYKWSSALYWNYGYYRCSSRGCESEVVGVMRTVAEFSFPQSNQLLATMGVYVNSGPSMEKGQLQSVCFQDTWGRDPFCTGGADLSMIRSNTNGFDYRRNGQAQPKNGEKGYGYYYHGWQVRGDVWAPPGAPFESAHFKCSKRTGSSPVLCRFES